MEAGPQPIPQDLAKLALYDPVSAYGMLLGIPRVPVCLNAVARFSSFAVNAAPISAGLDTTIAYRTWIDNITYSLDPAGQFSGNIFQTLYASQLRAKTCVSMMATVQAGPKYPLMGSFMPLENLVNQLASQWSAGWLLFKQQSILTQFILNAVPGGDATSLTSYGVTVTYNGWQFLDPSLDEMSGDDAARCLRKYGIFVPETDCKRRSPMG